MGTPTVARPSRQRVWAAIEDDVDQWYESKRNKKGKVNTNVMCVGLILADHMAEGVPILETTYRAESQVKSIGASRIRQILARHGETRRFRSEAGRTSRGSLPLAHALAPIISDAAAAAGYGKLSDDDQAHVRNALQAWFVDKVQTDYFGMQRLTAAIDPALPVRVNIAELLEAARTQGGNNAGAVAQHLVGAKLAMRFPDEAVSNHGYTTADVQTSRPGDFSIGDTAIHVTMSPIEALFTKCSQNLADGYRPIVLVPENRLVAGRQIAETTGVGSRVSVQAIEDYVGNNVEEIGGLSESGVRAELKKLLETYNTRVDAVESDPSLLIDIPGNL